MLIDEEVRESIMAPIDGGVGVDGRQDEGEAADLLRDIRLKRKVGHVEHRLADNRHVHQGFNGNLAIGLGYAFGHFHGHG